MFATLIILFRFVFDLYCRNELIPRGVVTDSFMHSELKKISSKLFKHDYEIAANHNQLLKLKVVRCTFGERKLEIRINLPVRRRKTTMKLHKLLHVPFNFQQQQCSLENEVTYVGQINSDMVPITPELQPNCNLDLGRLCMLSEGSFSPSPFTSCAEAYVGSTQSEIVNKCVMKCSERTGTWVSQLSSSDFVVTNSKNISVTCGSGNQRLYAIKEVGAIVVKLGCSCKVRRFLFGL